MSPSTPSPELFEAAVPAGCRPLPEAPAIRILVAEDNAINRDVIMAQLDLLGLVAEVAENGEAALLRWRRGGFQLLLTDLQMPVMDGFALAARVRAEEQPSSRIPIVALTASALPEEALRCRAAGMDDCLTKPIRLPALAALFEQLFGPRHPAITGPTPPTPVPAPAPPPPARRAGPRQPVDISVLAATFGDDPARLDELLDRFARDAATMAVTLAAAVAQGQPGQVAALAQAFKASARSFGAIRLGNLCAHIEAAGGAADGAALAASLGLFEDEAAAVGRWIAARAASTTHEQEQP